MAGLDFFAELNATNAAYCHAHGMSAGELYGTAPNAAEYETALIASISRLNSMGPLKGMSGHTAPRAAPAHHAVVEYARPVSMWDRTNIQPYYDDCRARSGQLAGAWVGD